MSDTTTVITANKHDNGFDLVQGDDVTGPVIGRVWWDNGTDPGLVLEVNSEQFLPEFPSDVRDTLAGLGYVLTDDSVEDIGTLKGW